MPQHEQMFSEKFQAFLETAKSLDLGPIAYQLMRSKTGPQWTQEQTTRAIAHYLAFLYLVHCYPHLQLVPTWEIDQVWHCHILDTSKYAADCQRLFGCFIHHFPYFGMQGEADRKNWYRAHATTEMLFHQHFGCGLTRDGRNQTADCEPLPDVAHWLSGCIPLSQPRPRIDIAVTDTLRDLALISTKGDYQKRTVGSRVGARGRS